MIEKYIKELLEQEGRAAVADLGTFFTKQQSASVDAEDAIVLPPVEVVTFTESIIDTQKDDLRNLIFEKGEMFASQIEVEIEKYVNTVKSEINSSGSYTIEGLGVLKNDDEGLSFEAKDSFSISSESFGLPKIEARPLEPISEESETSTDEVKEEVYDDKPANANIPWLIIAPLALLAVAIAYFLLNPAAFENIKSMFPDSKPETEISTPAEQENTENIAEGETTTEETPDSANTDNKPEAKETEKKAEEPRTTTPKPVVNNEIDIVTQPTNRFYLIAGSFKTVASAKKALQEAKSKGYSGAKIVKSDNRYRLSIGDYPTKSAATTAGVSAGKKDYKGAWPFKF